VNYARDGSRFLGATFDATALYRFNVVQEWMLQQGLTVENMLAHVRAIERTFLRESRSAELCAATLVAPEEARRGRFLAFRTSQAGTIVGHLATKNIIADHRGNRLRIGFGIYHTEDDAKRLADALA
jgi:selenocysteine lyase/cysteine desulfurase